MSPRSLRHPVLCVSVLAGLGAGIAAPAVQAAAPAAPSVPASQRSATTSPQLLDGLLGGVLGTVTGPLQTVIAPLVDSAGALPEVLPASTVATLTGALTGAVPGVVPADVTKLLTGLTTGQVQQLAATPASATMLLQGLLPTVTSLVGSAAPGSSAISGVVGQLTALLSGGLPTDAVGLETLTGLLGGVTSLLGTSGAAGLPDVQALITRLVTLGAALPTGPVKTAITDTVATAAAKGGIDISALLALLASLGLGKAPAAAPAAPTTTGTLPTIGGRPSTPTTPAAASRAEITQATMNQRRSRLSVRISCPASAAAACKVQPSAKVAGKTVRLAGAKTVPRGTSRVLRAKVPAALAKRLRAKGGRLSLQVTTAGVAGADQKSTTIRRGGR